VAAAIIEMLDMIRKVVPPLFVTNSEIQLNSPTSKIEAAGICLPPSIAKLTALNIPAITKKNKNVFAILRLIGLRISDGFSVFSASFRPYKNPIAKAGANNMLISSGDDSVNFTISGWKFRNNIIEAAAAETKITRFKYLNTLWGS